MEYLTPAPEGGLYWGELTRGILIHRYKRFLADVEVEGGVITAHTPNTGRMLGCCLPGRPVWLSRHDNPGRKYAFTLEMIDMPTALVGLNTSVPNKLAALAALDGVLAELSGPATRVDREVAVGRSRLDLRIVDRNGCEIMVEVKNCTLAENGTAYFPDAVTARGAKHLDELAELAGEGRRAAILIVVQRADADCFSPADHIDPEWGRRLRAALAVGVEIWAYRADLDLQKISLGKRLSVIL